MQREAPKTGQEPDLLQETRHIWDSSKTRKQNNLSLNGQVSILV